MMSPAALIPLSPIDHLFTGRNAYPISFLFEYAGRLDADGLRRSLAETATDFPPVSSRLANVDDRSWGFSPQPNGYDFIADRGTETFDASHAVRQVESLPGEPLLRIRLSVSNGRSALGVSFSHAVVDGYSAFLFLTAWARRHRGETPIVPDHERRKLIPDMQYPRSERLTAEEVRTRTGWEWAGPRVGAEPGRQRRSIHLTKAKLQGLQQENDLAVGMGLSFNDLITAHLCLTEAPNARYLVCPFDFRRLHPHLGAGYFGNAVVGVRVPVDPGVTLKELCFRIRDSVRGVDLAYVQDSLLCLEELRRERGLAVTEELAVVHPAEGLLITNLSRIPLKELDFGAGLPEKIRFLTPIPGTAVILPSADGFEVQMA